MDKAAILGTYVRIQTMSDGTPRIVIDLQCSLADIAALNLTPGSPIALARLTNESSVAHTQQSEAKPKGGALARLAGMWCNDPEFLEFLNNNGFIVENEDHAAEVVRHICNVASRSEIDSNSSAAKIFHDEIRIPFMEYLGDKK